MGGIKDIPKQQSVRKEPKSNTFTLTAIYSIVILIALAVLGWYISTL